jgi:hypothetical protein
METSTQRATAALRKILKESGKKHVALRKACQDAIGNQTFVDKLLWKYVSNLNLLHLTFVHEKYFLLFEHSLFQTRY